LVAGASQPLAVPVLWIPDDTFRKIKSKKARNVPLSQRAVDALKRRPRARDCFPAGGWIYGNFGALGSPARRAFGALLKFPADFVLTHCVRRLELVLGEAGCGRFHNQRLHGPQQRHRLAALRHPSPESLELAFERLTVLIGKKSLRFPLQSEQRKMGPFS